MDRFQDRLAWSAKTRIDMIDHEIDRGNRERPPLDPEFRRSLHDELKGNVWKDVDRQVGQLNQAVEYDGYIARNTAYAFYGGSEVARYQKRSDHKEVFVNEWKKEYVIFEPGGGPDGRGDLFRIEELGLTFGLEICLDHQCGYLRQSGNRPDVHIVVSAETTIEPDHVSIPEGHYLVHASSDLEASGIYDHEGAKKIRKCYPDKLGYLIYRVLKFEIDN